ncbi:MAG: hypothetical protein P9L92_01750 [Candidatus Electryonea clarkiae]|nr:hypothetical protein [Candidatus Electryonea clarkiae]MDP8285106.1 hypothetical protein [Candidatus Electryonea clarkiae]
MGGSLTLGENVEIGFQDLRDSLLEGSPVIDLLIADLYINATAENPLRITLEDTPDSITTDLFRYINPGMPLNHDTSWSGLDVTGSSFKIRIPDKLENSSFEGEKVSIEAEYRAREDSNSVNISQCVFIADTVRFEQEQNVWNSISRSLVTGHFENCFRILDRITFANETGTAVENIRRNAVIMNSFFFGYDTLVSGDSSFIDYSAYLNMEDQPVFGRNVTVGENFLGERNPRFVDPDAGDYHLQSGSDLIDAGNPDSDPDPDGTRADIGAYFFD